MRFTIVAIGIAMLAGVLVGCAEKTPEQIEADKYPRLKPLTPEQDKAVRARLGGPITGPTGQNGPPGQAAPGGK